MGRLRFFAAQAEVCETVFVKEDGACEQASLTDHIDALRDPVHGRPGEILAGKVAHAERADEGKREQGDGTTLFELDGQNAKHGIHDAESRDHQSDENERALEHGRYCRRKHGSFCLLTADHRENARSRKQKAERLHREEHIVQRFEIADSCRIKQLPRCFQRARDGYVDRACRKKCKGTLAHFVVKIAHENDRRDRKKDDGDIVHKRHRYRKFHVVTSEEWS